MNGEEVFVTSIHIFRDLSFSSLSWIPLCYHSLLITSRIDDAIFNPTFHLFLYKGKLVLFVILGNNSMLMEYHSLIHREHGSIMDMEKEKNQPMYLDCVFMIIETTNRYSSPSSPSKQGLANNSLFTCPVFFLEWKLSVLWLWKLPQHDSLNKETREGFQGQWREKGMQGGRREEGVNYILLER